MASGYVHATQVFAELTLTMTHSSKIKVLIAHGDPLIAARTSAADGTCPSCSCDSPPGSGRNTTGCGYCTGGVAPLDMMLTLIDARFGSEVANKVSDQFIVERMRHADQPQPGPMRSVTRSGSPVLSQAAQLMERTIENPIAVSKVARKVGVSPRQLERLFDRYLHTGPAAFYLSLRVTRARELLHLTTMSVTEVAVACGFRSAAHFSTCYRRVFGRPPRHDRLV